MDVSPRTPEAVQQKSQNQIRKTHLNTKQTKYQDISQSHQLFLISSEDKLPADTLHGYTQLSTSTHTATMCKTTTCGTCGTYHRLSTNALFLVVYCVDFACRVSSYPTFFTTLPLTHLLLDRQDHLDGLW